jgi:hypothetical protein
MLISTLFLNNSLKSYNISQKRKTKENFILNKTVQAGATSALETFILVISVVFFMLEILVLYYSITIALNCSKGGPEKIVNLVLAVTFTLPYALFNLLLNDCAKITLQNNNGLLLNNNGLLLNNNNTH